MIEETKDKENETKTSTPKPVTAVKSSRSSYVTVTNVASIKIEIEDRKNKKVHVVLPGQSVEVERRLFDKYCNECVDHKKLLKEGK